MVRTNKREMEGKIYQKVTKIERLIVCVGVELKQRELDEIHSTKAKRENLAPPQLVLSLSGNPDDIVKACAALFRDSFANIIMNKEGEERKRGEKGREKWGPLKFAFTIRYIPLRRPQYSWSKSRALLTYSTIQIWRLRDTAAQYSLY